MWTVIQGDAQRIPLGDGTVQCVVTSPPFWGLRDYGIGDNALGLEPTPELYIEHMVEIFREVRRVLRKDGTVWMNLGDVYNSKPASTGISYRRDRAAVVPINRNTDSLKIKDLCGIPWRVALALQADGWWLRSDIIWSKPNPMPESVTDRPTRSHEYVFLLTKAANYYYDQEAVREPWTCDRNDMRAKGVRTGLGYLQSDPVASNSIKSKRPDGWASHAGGHGSYHRDGRESGETAELNIERGRNLRSVWHIPTQPFPEAHFATFPQALVEPCIKAGTSEKGACAECGNPRERITETPQWYKELDGHKMPSGTLAQGVNAGFGAKKDSVSKPTTTLGWQPTCKCLSKEDSRYPLESLPGGEKREGPGLPPVPCLVLDPFAGSGTVGVVCIKLNRSFVGIELKADYCDMANKRVFNSGSLLAI